MRIPQIVMGVGLVVLVVLLLSPQRHPPAYNAAAEVTLHGVVENVRDFYCPVSGTEGTHLMVATENGTVEVHVAPSQFLLGKHLEFFRGDQVEVTGSRTDLPGPRSAHRPHDRARHPDASAPKGGRKAAVGELAHADECATISRRVPEGIRLLSLFSTSQSPRTIWDRATLPRPARRQSLPVT